MFTADEKRAIIFLAAVAATGGAVRALRHADPPAPAAAVAPELRDGDLQRQAALARRAAEQARPLGAGETIDVDVADARDIERLPGVGPSLAAKIVADRAAHGPFGSPEGLDQVPGVGPAMLARITPHVRFSGPPRAMPQIPAGKAVGHRRRGTPRAPLQGG